MTIRKGPFLDAGERALLQAPGGCKTNFRSGWILGCLCLTNKRLLFSRSNGLVSKVSLYEIGLVALEKARFVLRTKDVIVLTYRPGGRQGYLKIWFITADLKTWRKKIHGRSLFGVDEEMVNRVAEAVDPESRYILLYLWQNRYAPIDELAELTGATIMWTFSEE